MRQDNLALTRAENQDYVEAVDKFTHTCAHTHTHTHTHTHKKNEIK